MPLGRVPHLLFSTQRILLCAHSRALLYISNILRRTLSESQSRDTNAFDIIPNICERACDVRRVSCANGSDALAALANTKHAVMDRKDERSATEREAGGMVYAEAPAYYLDRFERAHFNNQMLLLASMLGIMIRLRISLWKHAEKSTLIPIV